MLENNRIRFREVCSIPKQIHEKNTEDVLANKISSEKLRERTKMEPIGETIKERRGRYNGRVLIKERIS